MLTLRLTRPEDIGQISLVLATSWRTAYRGMVADDYLNTLKDDHWVAFLTAELTNDTLFSMVLQDREAIIGASVIRKSETDGEVHLISLYLLPDRIGQGLGHIFYCGIEKEMQSRGFSKCTLDVLENNERAIRFYRSHGFLEADSGITAVLGEHSYPCKVFEKTLPKIG